MRAGNVVMVVGIVVVAIGAALRWAPWLVTWFGRLPGDIHIEGQNTRIFVPITSMLLLSLLASLIFYAGRSFFGDR